MSDYKPPKYKDIPQYLIVTQNEWVEFISPGEPTWNIHKNASTQKLINLYSKKIQWG